MTIGTDSGSLSEFVKNLTAACASSNRRAFAKLHFDLGLIEYRACVDRSGWAASPGPQTAREEYQCSHPNCRATWQTPDACLLLINGKWLCRAHHPETEIGGNHPTGWTKQVRPVDWTTPAPGTVIKPLYVAPEPQ